MNSLILATGARLLTALFLLFSLYVLLRGHNAPGGGFIGGLIAAAGFTLFAFSSGTEKARAALRVDPRSVGAVGMGLSLIAGVIPAIFNLSPFTGVWYEIGDVALSTVLAFDIGVYLAVFGSILTLVFALEEVR